MAFQRPAAETNLVNTRSRPETNREQPLVIASNRGCSAWSAKDDRHCTHDFQHFRNRY
jgi:hypothetical protein